MADKEKTSEKLPKRPEIPISTTDEKQSNEKPLIELKRNAIDWDDCCVKYGRNSEKEIPFCEQVMTLLSTYWKRFSLLDWIHSLFPIIDWLPKYRLKADLMPDVIAGMTVSVMHIPQGIAYSLLAGLEPVNGLYVSFFPVLIYTLMGTSRHISIGSFAVASLMLSDTAMKIGSVDTPTVIHNATTNETIYADWPPTTLEVLITVSLVTGAVQIVMGLLCLGSLSLILSDHLVSGFTSGVAFYVVTTQMNAILGLSVPNQKSGPFKLINTWIAFGKDMNNANIATIVFSLIIITILLVFKEWAEPRIKKKTWIPIPIDLLVIIFSTLISWIIGVTERFHVVVVGEVPTGLPLPTIPRLDFVDEIFIDSIIIGFVTIAITISLAKIFARKHKYDIRPNQELIALGTANVFSSFFHTYASSAALARSSVQEQVGGRTQMAGIISCLIILIVLLLLAPLLYHLPTCALSCIIIIALKPMFLQIGDLKNIYIVSKLDATVWSMTFFGVLLLDVELGLYVGICVAIFVILVRLVKPSSSVLGNLPSTEIYVDVKKFIEAKEIYGIKILRFCSPIFYLSVDNFKTKVMETTQVMIDDKDMEHEKQPQIRPEVLIIDMSCVGFMDRSGMEAISDVMKLLRDQNISTCLVCCPLHVIELFERTEFFKTVDKKCIFPTISDAVISFR